MEIVYLIQDALTVVAAMAVFLYLTAFLYPRLILRPVWLGRRDPFVTGDRGVRRVTFPGGRATVYEPIPKARRYLRRYALIKQDGCTYLRCRIHENIAYIRYDAAAFDSRGRLLDVLSVSERVTEAGYTRAVRLPRDTAYACVTLRRADGVYEDTAMLVGYSYTAMGIFAGLCVLTAALTGWLVQGSLADAFDLLGWTAGVSGTGLSVIVAAVLGVLYAAAALQLHYLRARKVMNT